MKLRSYQQNSISELYAYIKDNKGLNPCLVLPTGSGKSLIIAKIASDFYKKGNGKLIMLTHNQELIEQNYKKVTQIVNPADVGVYSSGIGKKQLDRKITFAGIQSIRKTKTPNYKVIIVDECHLISTKQSGTYRDFIDKFPDALVIGLTATPYRMDNGYINVGDKALFSNLVIPDGTTIPELIENGYLSALKSKVSDIGGFDFGKVKKIQGDYNAKEVNNIVNHHDAIQKVIVDIIERAKDYKHVLVFCAGIEHSENVSKFLCDKGEKSFYVHGKMTQENRKMAINSFKDGALKFLCNPNILTTGFDFPDIDCVVMLRPTYSVGLYVQIAGRGLRLKSHTDHCLILDYVGNIERNGTIINPKVKDKKEPSTHQICPNCLEVNEKYADKCVDCGYDFTTKEEGESTEGGADKQPKKPDYALSNLDIMFDENKPRQVNIVSWDWKVYFKKEDGKKGIIVNFVTDTGEKLPMFLAIESAKAQFSVSNNLSKIILAMNKEFYIDMNPNDNIFYIIIDGTKMNATELCYFMNLKDTKKPDNVIVKKHNGFNKFVKINF